MTGLPNKWRNQDHQSYRLLKEKKGRQWPAPTRHLLVLPTKWGDSTTINSKIGELTSCSRSLEFQSVRREDTAMLFGYSQLRSLFYAPNLSHCCICNVCKNRVNWRYLYSVIHEYSVQLLCLQYTIHKSQFVVIFEVINPTVTHHFFYWKCSFLFFFT